MAESTHRVRRLFGPSSWPSWLLLVIQLVKRAYEGLDAWGNADFLVGKMSEIAALLNSWWAVFFALVWLFVIAFGGHTRILEWAGRGGTNTQKRADAQLLTNPDERRRLELQVSEVQSERERLTKELASEQVERERLTAQVTELKHRIVADARPFSTEVSGVSLGGLWSGQKSMRFSFVVKRLTATSVRLTGVKGYITIRVRGKDETLRTLHLDPAEAALNNEHPLEPTNIEATLDRDTAVALREELASDNHRVPVKLFLTWVGECVTATGPGALPELWLPREQFYLLAPVRSTDAVTEVWRLGSTLGSSDWYETDGTPKHHVLVPKFQVRVVAPSSASATPGTNSFIPVHMYVMLINRGGEREVLEWCNYVIRGGEDATSAKLLSVRLVNNEGLDALNIAVPPHSESERIKLISHGDLKDVVVPQGTLYDALEYKLAGQSKPIELPLKQR